MIAFVKFIQFIIYMLQIEMEISYISVKQVPNPGHKLKNGYLACMVRKHGQNGQKGYSVHRFVYECFNGIIPDGKVIDHVNNINDDNRLCNLQLKGWMQNRLMSNFRPFFDFSQICQKFCM